MPCFKDRRTFPHIDTVLNEVSKRSVLLGEMYRFDQGTKQHLKWISSGIK